MPRAAKTETTKAARKLPSSESGHGVHYVSKNGREYCVSHCPEKERFTLWRIVDDGYEKVKTASDPRELYQAADAEK